MNARLKNIFVSGLVVAVALSFLGIVAPLNITDAAAVTLSVSSPSNGEFAGTSAQDVTLSFTANTEFLSGDTISVTVNHTAETLPGALANCTSATTDIDGDTTTDGSFGSFTTTGATYTFTAGTTQATTSASFCIRFPASTPQGSWSITMTSTNGDAGGALVYVGDDNDVFITAEVALELSFNIRTADDTADTNECQIGLVGTVSTAAVGATKGAPAQTHECAYGLAIGTSASNGFSATIQADAAMTNGTDSITNITDATTFSAGTEAYGIVELFPGTTGHDGAGTFNQTLTLGDDAGFTYSTGNGTNSAPVPIIGTDGAKAIVSYNDTVQYTAGTDNSDLTVVVHGMNAASATPAGVYSQTVTYYVTPSF